MSRTILIPTDFSIESLRLLKEALQPVQIGRVRIILFYCVQASDSIVDLLFFSRKDQTDALLSDNFRDACKILSSKYNNRIHSMAIEVFSGGTQRAFQNFLLANGVDEILLPNPFTLQLAHRNSFSPEPFIRQSGALVTEVNWQQVDNIPEKNKLAEIFLL